MRCTRDWTTCRRRLTIATLAAAFLLHSACARAINVTLDYTYDTTNFFGSGNPSGAAAGAQAKSAVEAAAAFFSNMLKDTFSSNQTPPDFHSSFGSGIASWDWTQTFAHPATNSPINIENISISDDEYRVYVGARNLGSATLGVGGPGGYAVSSNNNGGSFSLAEIIQLNQITNDFFNSVQTRGETSGFSSWGGTLTFDSVGTAWNYNHTVAPSGGVNDFYAVAVHELAHSLGFGASDEWSSLAGSANFSGPAAAAEYGSNPPLSVPPRAHWASGTMSTVFETIIVQEAAMDPELSLGTRKLFTDLDAAALVDIGWEIRAVPEPSAFAITLVSVGVLEFSRRLSTRGMAQSSRKLASDPAVCLRRFLA